MTERGTRGRALSSAPATELEEILWVGYVAKAHGLTGEIEVRPDWSGSLSLVEAKQLLLDSSGQDRKSVV